MKNTREPAGRINLSLPCKEIMSTPLYSCDASDTVFSVSNKMKIEEIERMPIFSKKKMVGIITSSALIEFMGFC